MSLLFSKPMPLDIELIAFNYVHRFNVLNVHKELGAMIYHDDREKGASRIKCNVWGSNRWIRICDRTWDNGLLITRGGVYNINNWIKFVPADLRIKLPKNY